MPKLIAHRYGKARVRVVKILRGDIVHRIKDIAVDVLLEGDFETSYTSGDNSKVVPTDTIKNTINVLAKEHLGAEIEEFAVFASEHFVKRYPQVNRAQVEIAERNWRRLEIEGKAHPHSFVGGGESKMFARVVCTRDSKIVQAGIRDLLILKSTGSGFENYPRDEFTTLPETADRILASSFGATWTFDRLPQNCGQVNQSIIDSMLKVFAENYSPSAQATLFQMGEAALAVCREISQIDLIMPNKHCLLIDLSPFGLKNENEVFVPTDEPHGQIEATVAR
ncbi:MAG: urate oxidase [Verrucomicrobiota bacterium]|jgi:urate oxidase